MVKIKLEIITQEEKLFSSEVDQISAPAINGEVTILPHHIPLFTRLNDSIIIIKDGNDIQEIAILGGFMDVAPENQVTIMADAAFRAESINIARAKEAKERAQKAMEQKQSEVDFRLAENELRRAILELRVARRRPQNQSTN